MKIFKKAKDGGPKSTVTGYWLFEFKRFFSIALLKFEDGSREEYHSHAFHSLNWVLKGKVAEEKLEGAIPRIYGPSLKPILTTRNTFHRVRSKGTTWVFSIRGPWSKTWMEYDPRSGRFSALTHGRKVVGEVHSRDAS